MIAFGDPNCESVLLASMLEFPEAYFQAIAMGIRPEHFSQEQNRFVARAIMELAESGQPVAFESLVKQLKTAPNREKLVACVEDLTNPLHMPRRNVEWHVKQLQDAARRTRFVSVCELGISLAQDKTQHTNECIEAAQESLLELQGEAIATQAAKVRDFMPDVIRNLEHRAQQQGLIGLATGIADLDQATTGIRPGELWVIGAMSGRGKTTLGAQIALANAEKGHAVVFFSLEMTRDELGDRFLCNESTVSAARIRNPSFIDNDQWRELAECAGRLAEWPLCIDDSPSLTIQALLARARLCIRRFGCRLVIVDYLRLIKAPGRELREQMGNATDALRQLAKSEHVGVVALSQLARPRDRNINALPTMLGLKESGDIEAHAHVVLLIHMPAKKGEPTGVDQIIIGKNRHGPMGAIDVTFSKERLKFLPRESERLFDEQDGSDARK